MATQIGERETELEMESTETESSGSEGSSEAMVTTTAAVAPPSSSVSLFKTIFSEEEEIKLLEEYKQFVETHGHNIRNKWVEFHKSCSLKELYTSMQISKKIVSLQTKFEKQRKKSFPVPRDRNKQRLFTLSSSLWRDQNQNPPKSVPKKRSLTDDQPEPSKKKKKEALQWPDLDVEELELYCKTLTLQRRQYLIIFEEMKRNLSKKKQSEEKEMPKSLIDNDADLLKNTTEEDPASRQYCGEERDESEDEKELNLQKIEPPVDGGVFGKEDINIAEDGQEKENEAVDLPIAFVEEKTDNQLSDLPNSGGMENVLALQEQSHVKVKDDGTKKTSSKKKKKMKRKKAKKGTSPQVKNQPFDSALEVLAEGDLNGKIVCKGAKVKIQVTAKIKGSEEPFEHSICNFNLGDERLIEGLRNGILGMRVGEKRRLTIPPSLGYGDEGYKDIIPPNSWLVYDIKLLAHGRAK